MRTLATHARRKEEKKKGSEAHLPGESRGCACSSVVCTQEKEKGKINFRGKTKKEHGELRVLDRGKEKKKEERGCSPFFFRKER